MIKKEQMGRQRINLNDIVTNVVHILSSDALLHWCELKTSLDTNLPMVEADPIQIQQVLINLVVNAFEAMPETPVSTREVEINTPNSLVFVIDDDVSVRKGLSRLLRSAGYESEIFSSAADFLARSPHPGPCCVIVDVRMPGLNGIDVQEALIQRRREEQLIFITGYGNIPMCARVMKAGAVDFLPKPFRNAELLQCIGRALMRSADQRSRAF